ncbi:MAG TPA: type II toxin-antitoxin system RelE/ParE family toxin [Actinomycetota bacterium]|nr:type II toxin-antitoxin system RelE/ParE family toxin [Actinomycetota bacterium]
MPNHYEVELAPAAEAGLRSLDKSEQRLVVRQLEKLSRAPQLGEPLGTKMGTALAGYRKLYAARRRVRIIYSIESGKLVVSVIAIGAREDAKVYLIADAEAQKRLRRLS